MHRMESHRVSSRRIASHRIASNRIASNHINLFSLAQSHRIASDRIGSDIIGSHRTPPCESLTCDVSRFLVGPTFVLPRQSRSPTATTTKKGDKVVGENLVIFIRRRAPSLEGRLARTLMCYCTRMMVEYDVISMERLKCAIIMADPVIKSPLSGT